MSWWELLLAFVAAAIFFRAINLFQYRYLKNRVLRRRQWDLNICSGTTDGGGVNADIVAHRCAPNFVLVEDIYRLPFGDKRFDTVLCSHTLEHVDDPDAFLAELKRVGKDVVIVLPPLWDIGAALNIFEHKWIFFTLRTECRKLPPRVPLPFAGFYHRRFGQVIRA
jgi:SAM-dependent methyltransferase